LNLLVMMNELIFRVYSGSSFERDQSILLQRTEMVDQS